MLSKEDEPLGCCQVHIEALICLFVHPLNCATAGEARAASSADDHDSRAIVAERAGDPDKVSPLRDVVKIKSVANKLRRASSTK